MCVVKHIDVFAWGDRVMGGVLDDDAMVELKEKGVTGLFASDCGFVAALNGNGIVSWGAGFRPFALTGGVDEGGVSWVGTFWGSGVE